MPRLRLLFVLTVVVIALPISSASAAIFTLNSTADDTDLTAGDTFCSTDSGACTLRAAIQEANGLAGNDTIVVPAGTYTLTIGGADEDAAATGDLDLQGTGFAPESLTITGAGARSTRISGVAGDRVFEIVDVTLTANISGLTISGGSAVGQGGGIFNSGVLNLTDATVSGNRADDPDFISNQGGGIFNNERMNLRNVAVTGNVGERGPTSSFGPQGAGIFDNGSPPSTLVNVTVSGNELIGAGAQGGGIFYNADPLSLTLTNTTIAGNLAPAPGAGAGLFVNDDITVVNSIVAQNLSGGSSENCAGSVATELLSFGHNLESGVDCDFTGSGDLQNANPLLGALTDNGGPTDTRALLAGSPALDAADPSACPSTDQRGIARPFGPGCDIGAFELFVAVPPINPDLDSDGDGVLDRLDACPTQPANTSDGCPLRRPRLGQTVNVRLLRGVVRVGVPAGATSRAEARASQKGITFVPLTRDRQIPVGSFLDTKRGTVELVSATDSGSKTQSGRFNAGLFQVLQSRKRSAKGLTELRLKGSSFNRCRARRSGTRAGAAQLSRRTIRRLRANAKGRFRTRGRHSAATVRGTVWITADRCDGTLTQVKRGRVAVRDLRRKRTITLTAGKSYLAQAPR